MNLDNRPVLAPHVYLQTDALTGQPVLIFREEMLELNEEAEAIISRCDGATSLAELIESLAQEYDAEASEIRDSVLPEVENLCRARLLLPDGPRRSPRRLVRAPGPAGKPGKYRPYVLLAELTYRCPLHCPYCSNPVRYPEGELSTEEWGRVFREAAGLGVLHVALSGGEPLLRADLVRLVREAADCGLYPNLITSGVGLDESRTLELREAGLESVQLSFQSDEAELADMVAGAKVHKGKLRAARIIRESGLALSLNVVLHRANISRLEGIIALAESLGAERVELANTQYYGWGYLNRTSLLPTREQVETARKVAVAAKQRLAGQMDIYYVLPDLYEARPKPCMQGWGRQYLTVNPAGEVLPCPTASGIPGMRFDNVRQYGLEWIWKESESFNRFRGTEWMPSPCRDCPQREIDFGGCRCQAALLAGDAGVTDPVCSLSPHRPLVDRILAEIQAAPEMKYQKRLNPGQAVTAEVISAD